MNRCPVSSPCWAKGAWLQFRNLSLLVLLMATIPSPAGSSCTGGVVDFFCGDQIEPSNDFWTTGVGTHSTARISGLRSGGVEFFQGAMLATKDDFPPSGEQPVTVRALVRSVSTMSQEFTICTRSDGQLVSNERDVLEVGSASSFNGFHTYSQLYFARNGACLHLSKVSQTTAQWYMKLVVVSPAQSAVCPSSSLVPLEVSEGEAWEVTLTDDGQQLVGMVESSKHRNTTAVSLSCSHTSPSARSRVVMFDYFKEDREQIDQARVSLGFASVTQTCSHLTAVQSNRWMTDSMPCSTALYVRGSESKLVGKSQNSEMEQDFLWNMPLTYQAISTGTTAYTDTQAFLIFVHVSRVSLQTANREVSVRLQASLCGSTIATLASNPRANSGTGVVRSSPMSMHGIAACSSSSGQDAVELSVFTTTDGTTESASGNINILGPGDINVANHDFAHAEILVTAVRFLKQYLSFVADDASMNTFQVTGSAKETNFLTGMGGAASLSASTTASKPNLIVFFDAPQLSSTDLDFYCLKFSITVNDLAVSNKSTCLPVGSDSGSFANKYFPFQMHADAPNLAPGANNVGVVFDTSCFLQTCKSTNGHVTANGPWRLSTLAVSDEAYFSDRSTLAADSSCSCSPVSEATRQPWTAVSSSPILTVTVTDSSQEVLILADLDRVETCQEQSVGLRIVRVEDSYVVSEISFYLAAVPPKSFAWHGSLVLEAGTHTFRLEYTSVYTVLFCSQWDSVEHKLSAMILPDARATQSEPAIIPRFENQDSSTDVTVTGAGFEQDSEIRMGFTACHQTTWVSESSLVCNIGPGVGHALSTVLTVDLVGLRTTDALFSYTTPVVATAKNSPVLASGIFLEATGQAFGVHDYSPSMMVGSTASLHTKWISDTSLHYSPAPGTSSAAIDAVVAGRGIDKSAVLVYHTYDAPFVTAVEPLSASTSGSSSITVLGGNLGAADYSLSLAVDRTRCTHTVWQSDSSMICALPPGIGQGVRIAGAEFAGGDGGESREVLENCTSDFCHGGLTMAFSYTGPVLDSLEWMWQIVNLGDQYRTLLGRSNGPASGAARITAWGAHFGTFSHTQIALSVGGTSCGETRWRSATSLSCRVAQGINFGRDVSMTIARQVVTTENLYSYDTPSRLPDEVTFAPSVANATGMTVLGKNLGHHDWSPRFSVGATSCSRTEWISDSSVFVLVPDGVGESLDVAVLYGSENVSSADAVPLYQFSYAAPSGGTPAPNSSNLPTDGATMLTVFATHFGGADYSNRLGIHGTDCESSGWFSDTSMICKSPAGAGFNRVLTASVSNQFMANGGTVSFDRPSVTSVKEANVPVYSDGATVTMLGKDFGNWDTSPTARIGDTACMSSEWVSSSSVLCKAPVGFNVDLRVTVTVARSAGTLSGAFTFDGVFPPVPSVTHVTPGAVSTLGSEITILGSFLGPAGLTLPAGARECRNRGAVPTHLPGSAECPFLVSQDLIWRAAVAYESCDGQHVGTACETTTWVSESTLLCSAPKGIGMDLSMVVESWPPEYSPFAQAGSKGVLENSIQHVQPQISKMTANLPSSGGNLTLEGSGFGTFDSTARIRLGQTACLSTTWSSDSMLSCKVASGRWSVEPLVLTMSDYSCTGLGVGASQTLAAPFDYDTATILDYSVGAGNRLALSGSNFGFVDLSPTVRIQGSAAAMTEWVSDSSVVAFFPPGVGGGLDLAVEYQRDLTVCGALPIDTSANETLSDSDDSASNNGGSNGTASNDENTADENTAEACCDCGLSSCNGHGNCDASPSPDGCGDVDCQELCSGAARRRTGVSVNCDVTDTLYHRGILDGGFSYAAPTASQTISDHAQQWSGNFSITIIGENFGVLDYSPQSRVGHTSCESATWLSATSLVCKVPQGSHAELSPTLPIAVSVQGQVGEGLIFDYENKGAVKLSLTCGMCADPGNRDDNVEQESVPLVMQPKVQILDHWDRYITAENETLVSASLVQVQGGTSTLGGNTRVMVVNGLATFTDLRVDGGSAGNNLQIRFSAPGLAHVDSSPFQVAYVDCAPAFVLSDPKVTSFTGGSTLMVQLEDFYSFSKEQMNWTFWQQVDETTTITIVVPVEETTTSAEGVTTISATIPAWDRSEVNPIVEVGLNVESVHRAWPPASCFQIILIDLTLPRVQEVAPGTCTTQGGGSQSVVMTDPLERFSREDFGNMELVSSLDGAEQSRQALTLASYLMDGTRVLSFTCPPYPSLDTLKLSIEIARGPRQGTLVCCQFAFFEPVRGFTLTFTPPPADISFNNVIPGVSHSEVDVSIFFPTEKLGVNETGYDLCDAVLEEQRTRMVHVAPVGDSEHTFRVPLLPTTTGRFPRSVPLLIDCQGSRLGQVRSGASFMFYRQPHVSRVTPGRVEVYGGVIEISIDGFLFPLRADQLLIELHMPNGQVRTVRQFSIPVQGLQRTVFAMSVPESADLIADGAYYMFKPQVVPGEMDAELFEARADFQYFQPPPEIVEMDPNVLEADGNVEVTLLISKFLAISSPSQIRVMFADDDVPLEVTQIIFSDDSSTSLRFFARAHTPGPVEILVSPASSPNNTGVAVLTYQGIGVFASCSKVQRSLSSTPVDLAPNDRCIVSSAGDSILTLRLEGFGAQMSDLRIVVGGILQDQDAWSLVASNAQTALVEVLMPPLPSNVERGPNGCLPPRVRQNIAVYLDSDQTKMAIASFEYNTVPCVASSRFAPSAIELELRFNQQTDQGGIVGSDFFDCARVLDLPSRVNPWGDGGLCFWINARQLNVMLGPGEDDELVNIGDFVSVLDEDLEIRSALGFNLTAVGTYIVTEPTRVVLPQVRISGPNQASACVLDQLVLTGLVTSPRSVTFRWSADDVDLNALVSTRLGPELVIPSSALVSGRDYVVSLEVVDFLGATSERANHNLRKVAQNIPVVRIDGARPFLASQSNFFLAVVRFSACIPEKEEMAFEWSVALPGEDVPVFESERPSLDIPPGVLEPSTSYVVRLSAGNVGRAPAQGSFDFDTGISPLISSIDGGDRLQPRGTLLELDASLSRDPDSCIYSAQLNDVFDIADDCFKDVTGGTVCSILCSDDSLVYEWSCRVKGLSCRKMDFSVLTLPSEPIIEVDLTEIADSPAEVTFEVTVTKGTRSSVSPVRITIIDLPSIPTLDIVLGFTRKTDSAGVRYVNRVDTIRGLAVTDYCDNVDCTLAGSEPDFSYSVVESIDQEEQPGNVLDADNAAAVPAGLNTPSIVISPNVLVTGKQYALKLDLTAGGNLLASSRIFLQINQPPSAGKCQVHPTTGFEIETSFAASCQKWFDQDLPLQYIFGYQARGREEVMITPAQLGASYEMKLPAGYVDITISVVDALGSPATTKLLALVNETAPDENALDKLDSMTEDAGKLGDTSGLVQQSSSAASQLEASRRRRHRELLASSAAYRMRVRRMLLRKAAGAAGAVDKTSGGPILGSAQSLSSSPEELVPNAGDPRDSVGVVDSNADLVYTSVCSVSSQELEGETANKAMETLAQLVSSVNRLPVNLRDRTLLSAVDSVTQITRSIGKGMTPGEPVRTMGKDAFHGAVQKLKVPSQLSFNIGNAIPGLNYTFTVPEWLAEAEVVLPVLYVSLPWETNLTQLVYPITSVFGVEVVIDRGTRRRRRGRRRMSAPVPRVPAQRTEPLRPFRRNDRPLPFGSPELTDVVSDLQNLEVTAIMPLRLERAGQDGGVRNGGKTWNESEVEQIRYRYNQTVECRQWDGFGWSDQNCPYLPKVSEDGTTVECTCTRAGLFLAVYVVPSEPLDDRDVVATVKKKYMVLGWPIWYILVVGIIALILTLLAEAKWHHDLHKTPYLHKDVHESRLARRYVMSGWFGELFPEDSQFTRAPTQNLEDRKKRFQDQSFKGYSFIINRDGDQTLIIESELHEFEDLHSARTHALLDRLKAEIARVLFVDVNRVRIGEVEQISEDATQIHIFYSHSLIRPARGLAEKLQKAWDTNTIQQKANRSCFGVRQEKLEMLSRLKEVKKGYDPVGLFLTTPFVESFKQAPHGTVASFGVGRLPSYLPQTPSGVDRVPSHLIEDSEVQKNDCGVAGPECDFAPAHDFRNPPVPPADAARGRSVDFGSADSPVWLQGQDQDQVTWTRTPADESPTRGPDDVKARLAGPDPDTLQKIEMVPKSIHGSVKPSPPVIAFGQYDATPSSHGRHLEDSSMSDTYGAAMASYLDGVEAVSSQAHSHTVRLTTHWTISPSSAENGDSDTV